MKPRLIRDAEKTLPKKPFRCKIGLHDYEYILDNEYRLLKVCLRCKKIMSFVPATLYSYSKWIDVSEHIRRQKLARNIHNHD